MIQFDWYIGAHPRFSIANGTFVAMFFYKYSAPTRVSGCFIDV